ncbi:MAG: hypothetical protein HYU35_00620 [Parcubacteria group bacterium]|nr:hypothetical protein [Parcubacteria group bacterium]
MMRCDIHSIEKTLFSGRVRRITLLTDRGQITVLGYHQPLVSTVITGPVEIEEESGTEHRYDFGAGFLEVLPENQGIVLLES